jgi:phosphate transport system protein
MISASLPYPPVFTLKGFPQMDQQRQLDRDIDLLRDRVLLLGGETETALQRSMYALIERNVDAAQEVLAGDDEIDKLEVEIDRRCIDVFALRQPAARDLRFVISVAKITPILERIADHACNIARVALDLSDEPRINYHPGLSQMAHLASAMLRSALDAFTSGDASAARDIIARDDEVDKVYHQVFYDLIEMMVKAPGTTKQIARLLFVGKHLERIADYVTDICELTVYMKEAEFLRHSN